MTKEAELLPCLERLVKLQKTIAADLSSAHSARIGPSEWMTEDDRDLRKEWREACEAGQAAITAWNTRLSASGSVEGRSPEQKAAINRVALLAQHFRSRSKSVRFKDAERVRLADDLETVAGLAYGNTPLLVPASPPPDSGGTEG